ncbi:MAG TPA: helix-turn-helix transcriptional regulator [Armatimonadota bacterium]|jgi:predicted XRE-type DNA-binding protein
MEFTTGSGNVFADLGLPEPEERLAKARVAYRIHEVIASLGLTQAQAARRTGLTQPNVSDITRGRLKGFTLERLFQCLNALDQDVEIVIRPKKPDADGAVTHVSIADNV